LTGSPLLAETLGDDPNDAFVTLLVQHRHALYAFIAKQLVNAADAEDVFQKTSIVLWKKRDQFHHDGSFFHWACGIAFNEIRNFLKVERRNKVHFDLELVQILAEEATAECALTESRVAALRECMAGLSSRQREILNHCYLGSHSITEVANALGRERSALYKQLARLKQKLLECIRLRVAAGVES